MIQLKHFGRWKSSSVAEGYIQESDVSKIHLAKELQGREPEQTKPQEQEPQQIKPQIQEQGVHLTNTPNFSKQPINNLSPTQYIPHSFSFQNCEAINNCTFQIIFSEKKS